MNKPLRYAVQALLFLVVVAAGVAMPELIARGSLLFAALPLLMALAALGLPPQAALTAGLLAAAFAIAKIGAPAFKLEPLSGNEWLAFAAFVFFWGLLLGAIAEASRGLKRVAALLVLLATPVYLLAVVPLVRSLDTVQRTSAYVGMRDGVRLAVDVYLPRGYAQQQLPAILHQTRTFRRTAIRWPYSLLFGGSVPADIRRFVASGYAYVYADVRGTGASFGARTADWSAEDIRDGAQLVDWIVAKPWSTGAVGATGSGWDGTAAEMLLGSRHPAVKASAPCFTPFDPYADLALPGGILASRLMGALSSRYGALDRNRPAELLDGLQQRIVSGVAPVDGLEHLLAEAVQEHARGFELATLARSVTYRDDVAAGGLAFARLSPFAKPPVVASKVPVYSYSGWYDGATARAALTRFVTLARPGSRVTIGPWAHDGRRNISPHRPALGASFDHTAELIRFFDLHVKGVDDGFGAVKPVRYYTLGEEAWKETDKWPPPAARRTLHFNAGQALAQSVGAGFTDYQVDYATTSGTGSRWRSQLNPADIAIGYPDRAEQDRKLLHYTSAPLAEDWEITGHPAVVVWLQSSTQDGQVFAYLEDVSPAGGVTYITEGQLRSLHRAENPLPYWHPAPAHSFLKEHGRPMIEGKPAETSIALLPVSYRVPKGHSIRIALAGADADQFAPPPGAAPTWRVYHDAEHPSRVLLPLVGPHIVPDAVEAPATEAAPPPPVKPAEKKPPAKKRKEVTKKKAAPKKPVRKKSTPSKKGKPKKKR